jgi:osmotically-inducible protein OsmY
LKDDIIVKGQLPGAQAAYNGSTRMQESAGAQGQAQSNMQGSAQYNNQYNQSTTAQSSSGWVKGTHSFNAVEPPAETSGSANNTSNVQNESAGAQSYSGQAYSGQSSTQNQNAEQNSDLAQRVRSDIQSDNTLNGQSVQVDTQGDKVILHGTVATKEQKNAIEAKAKAIPGVRSVSNKIDVQQ